MDPHELEALIRERQAAVKRALERVGINPTATRSERLAKYRPPVAEPDARQPGDAPRPADAPQPADVARFGDASQPGSAALAEPAARGPDERAAAVAAAPAAEPVPAAADAACDPFSELDPFLVPAVRAAAAAKAAAARIRTGAADLTVRDPAGRWRARHQAPVAVSPGLSIEQARAATTVAFRPRRAGSGPLPYAIEYARPSTRTTDDAEPADTTTRALAPAMREGRFERFRQELASRNGHAAEDPLEHPWSRTVPVPVNRAEQGRPARWWHLSRLFGRA